MPAPMYAEMIGLGHTQFGEKHVRHVGIVALARMNGYHSQRVEFRNGVETTLALINWGRAPSMVRIFFIS